MRWTSLGLAAGLALALAGQGTAAPTRISGDYVEARSASVYAGGCHFGSEYMTDGRYATLVWSIRTGSWNGVPLDGVKVMAVVSGQGNLAQDTAARKSAVYVDSAARDAQAKAVVEALKARAGKALGQVAVVKRVPIRFEKASRAYKVVAPGVATLTVEAMPNDECCKQPSQVWYKPFVSLSDRRVGYTVEDTYKDTPLALTWSRGKENSAFYGSFTL